MREGFEAKLEKTAKRLGLMVKQMPHHIAIIMDGNGRWAQKKGLPRVAGHRQGGKTVERIAQCCVNFGIESLTLYSFSIENWKRPKAEVNSLMHLYSRYLIGIRDTLMKNNVKLIVSGLIEQLPRMTKESVLYAISALKNNTGLKVNLALNYSSRLEITEAVRKISQQVARGDLKSENIDENVIANNLFTAGLPDPDLLIRTSGEFRISNFLLWQIAYSEIYISDTLWPDFRKKHFYQAIESYQLRERRFGMVSEQLKK